MAFISLLFKHTFSVSQGYFRLRRRHVLKIFALVAALLSSPSSFSSESETKVRQALEKLSLEQKVGQLFVFGFGGTQMTPSLKKWFETNTPGSLILFKRNIKEASQVARLNHAFQFLSLKKSELPLLLMVDQEGGPVSRLQLHPTPPSALAMGKAKDLELIQRIGTTTGSLLKTLGFNMNLAPVLDLSDPSIKNFVGNRAFGDQPNDVGLAASSFAKGLTQSGIMPTAKHFPGHGRISQDSHRELPRSVRELEELKNEDLVPYKAFFALEKPTAIMAAHVAFPKIDPNALPASFSKPLIQDLLRVELHYDGLILTDDIEMAGAGAAGSVGERSIRALEAGCDMIMVAWSPNRQAEAIRSVLAAVRSGRLSEERIDESVRRILAAKFGLPQPAKHLTGSVRLMNEYRLLAQDLARLTRKVTALNFEHSSKGFSYLKGTLTKDKAYYVFAADSSFYRSLKKGNKVPMRWVPLSPKRKPRIAETLKAKPKAFGIYYLTGSGTARILSALPAAIKARLLVINGASPSDVPDPEAYFAVINTYTTDSELGGMAAGYFFGPQEDERLPAMNEEEEEDDSSALAPTSDEGGDI